MIYKPPSISERYFESINQSINHNQTRASDATSNGRWLD